MTVTEKTTHRGHGNWVRLPDEFGPYEVSDSGYIRNLRGLILKPEISKTGHLRVQLSVRPGVSKHFQVHRLVARAFLGESDLDVLHWDDDPQNNRVENLRYGTDKENWWDGVRNGRRRVSDYCLRGHLYSETRDDPPRKRCYTCELDKDRSRYWERLSSGLHPSDERHGFYSGYRAGCRCDGCRGANRKYKTEWAREDRRKKREVSAKY